jgi:hypothetical protein
MYNLLHSLSTTIIFFLGFLICSSVMAQSNDEEEEAITSAMAAMDEFMVSFNARDADSWAASLNYPHVMFASGTVTVWDSAEEFALSDSFERLQRAGWDHSHWLTRDVILVSPEKVHISTVFQRYNSENQPISTYQSLYMVTKVDGHWGTQARSSMAP